jgi:hypothetical protein
MTLFVHIADERDAASIRRAGLTLPKAKLHRRGWGIFALPVVEDFMLTHQWVRELARGGHRSAIGVYFRVPDNEPVQAGLFGEKWADTTAAATATRLRAERLLGYEVIISRSIKPEEIHAIRPVPPIGWRFFPGAKGAEPRCLCRYCVRGDIKSQRLRKRLRKPWIQYA